MGLGVDVIHLINGLKRLGYLNGEGSVVEIGTQQLADSFLTASDALDETAQLFGASTPFLRPETQPSSIAHGSLMHLNAEAPPARDFWHWLGFRYAAVDIEGTPDSIPMDLNYDTAPMELKGSFDIVTNFGTTEHIANQLNVFNVIHDLVAIDGLMLHQVSMQGMLNHGLFNYNYKFFWMLCRSNNYRTVAASLSGAGASYSLPQNIVDSLIQFDHSTLEKAAGYRFADASLTIVLQKTEGLPYAPPLDLPT